MKDGSRPAVEFHLRELFVGCNEELLVKPLSLVQSEYPTVQLGSYPNTSTTYVQCDRTSSLFQDSSGFKCGHYNSFGSSHYCPDGWFFLGGGGGGEGAHIFTE